MTYGMSLEDGEPKALDQMKMQYTTIDTTQNMIKVVEFNSKGFFTSMK